MLQFSRSNPSRAPSASTTQLFATSAHSSRTGISCRHRCICSRKLVQQCHYTYWRGARFSHHPLSYLQDRKLSSSVEPACLYSEEGGSGHLYSNGCRFIPLSQVRLQLWALGLQACSLLLYILLLFIWYRQSCCCRAIVAKWSYEHVSMKVN